jgi:hypothetical protein
LRFHGVTHNAFEFAEPLFDVFHWVQFLRHLDGLLDLAHVGVERRGHAVGEVDASQPVEDVDEELFNELRVGASGQDRQQGFVRDELETSESLFLLLEVGVEFTLALLELLLEVRQTAHDHIIFATLFDVLDVFSQVHVLDEVLVDVFELGSFLGQTLSYVLSRKDRLERRPKVLDLVPLFDSAFEVGEHVVENLDLVHEGRHELLRLQPADFVLVVGQVVDDLGWRREDPDRFVLVLSEVENLVPVPQVADLLQLLERLLLVLGAVDDFEYLLFEGM